MVPGLPIKKHAKLLSELFLSSGLFLISSRSSRKSKEQFNFANLVLLRFGFES